MPIATPQGTLDFKSVDKVTFVGASSNTVIDTTTGSLGVGVGVGGPTSNLHVVGHTRLEGDINMLHTANTASIKLNSNVVTEFPRSKKLIKYPRVALNSASQDGYVVTASTDGYVSTKFHRYDPFRPFVSGTGTNSANGWHSGPPDISVANNWDQTFDTSGYNKDLTSYGVGGYAGTSIAGIESEWLKLELPHKIILSHFYYQHRDGQSKNYAQAPRDFRILGSNDDVNWDTIQTFTDEISLPEGKTLTAEASKGYKYLAFVVTKTWVTSGTSHLTLKNLEYYGVPEYDPEAYGTDVTIKSLPNVPNTDWLEVYYDAKDLTSISGTIADLSGKSVTGSLNGNVSIDTLNNVKSFSFDGSGDYISGTLTNTGDFDFTVSTWVFETNDTTTNTVWMIGSGSSSNNPNPSVALAIDSAGSLDFFVFSGIEIRMPNFRDTFGINKWHHIVCTRTGTNLKFFINGVDQGKPVNNSDTLSIAANSVFNIGARTGNQLGTNPMHGKIANFRIFNRVLSNDEIYQLYAYQKEEFGHGDLSMTLKAGRLGIGTSEPKAVLDVRGDLRVDGHTQLETLAPRYYSSMQRGTFHNVSSHIITGFDHQAEGYATPALGWEVHINFNHHRNMATHVEIDGGYLSTAPTTHVAISEVATRKYDEDTSAFSFYSDRFYIGSDIANAHAAAYAVIRITNSQVPGMQSAIHAGNSSTVRYHMLGHTMYVKPGIGSCLDVAIGKISGGDNARLHGIRVATGADNITGSYTVYTYH